MISRRQFIASSSATLLASTTELNAQERLPAGMLTKAIPSSGEHLPVIGLGTLEAFDVDADSEAISALDEILLSLVAKGGTLLDTSASPRYGSAEVILGNLAKKLAITDKLFLATKVYTEGEQAGLDEMHQSLENLHVSQIDLMQVHSMRGWETHLPSIRKLRDEGKVRHIGVSIHRDTGHEQMMQLMRTENLDFVQVNYNLIERNAAKELLPLAQDLGVAVMVNVPFAKAELFKKTSGVDLPEWASDFDCESWAQFFLKYIVSHPAVTCAIPRTSKPYHMIDNLQAGFGEMPDAAARIEMERLIDSLA